MNTAFKDKFSIGMEPQDYDNYENFISFSLDDIQSLLFELKQHQIALKKQNAELIKIKEELEKSELHYFSFFKDSPVAFAIIDFNGFIKDFNLRFAELTNIQENDKNNFSNIDFRNFLDRKDISNFDMIFYTFKNGSTKFETPLTLVCKDNNKIRIHLYAKPFLSDNNFIILTVCECFNSNLK